MRYDKPITFRLIDEVYDTETGDYEEAIKEEHTEYGSVVDTDIKTMQVVYGEVRHGSLTFSLQNKVGYTFNRIFIDGKEYSVDARIKQKVKEAYVISEV